MKYEIYMEGMLPQVATIIVEASDVEEAEAIALKMSEDGEIDWEDCDWSCYSACAVVIEDYENITNVEEIASIEVFHKFVEQITLTKGVEQ